MSLSMKQRVRLVAMGLFFALMFTYAGTNITLNLTRGKLLVPLVRGWLVTPREGRLVVSYVSAGGPASRLQVGDEILALDGQPLSSLGRRWRDESAGRRHDAVGLVVSRK